jgi:non-canonical (house-cleaning) NTP pyrophosphatase
MCTLAVMAKRKPDEGKPMSDAEKAARDRAQKALKKAKTEQVGEEAGAQITEGDLFKKPPTPKKR